MSFVLAFTVAVLLCCTAASPVCGLSTALDRPAPRLDTLAEAGGIACSRRPPLTLETHHLGRQQQQQQQQQGREHQNVSVEWNLCPGLFEVQKQQHSLPTVPSFTHRTAPCTSPAPDTAQTIRPLANAAGPLPPLSPPHASGGLGAAAFVLLAAAVSLGITHRRFTSFQPILTFGQPPPPPSALTHAVLGRLPTPRPSCPPPPPAAPAPSAPTTSQPPPPSPSPSAILRSCKRVRSASVAGSPAERQRPCRRPGQQCLAAWLASSQQCQQEELQRCRDLHRRRMADMVTELAGRRDEARRLGGGAQAALPSR